MRTFFFGGIIRSGCGNVEEGDGKFRRLQARGRQASGRHERTTVRPVPHAGPALRSAGRTLAGVWRGRPCARGDAGRLAGRVAVRVVPRGLVLGREGACVGVRRVPSGARGGVAAEQVARGRAVVFEFIGVPGGFWSQSGRKKPKKISSEARPRTGRTTISRPFRTAFCPTYS